MSENEKVDSDDISDIKENRENNNQILDQKID